MRGVSFFIKGIDLAREPFIESIDLAREPFIEGIDLARELFVEMADFGLDLPDIGLGGELAGHLGVEGLGHRLGLLGADTGILQRVGVSESVEHGGIVDAATRGCTEFMEQHATRPPPQSMATAGQKC